MKFRTELNPDKLSKAISYDNQILALGSCFAENIGGRLAALKYQTDINPFGIQYNPATIADGLQRIISGTAFEISDLFEYDGEWHSFSHHSDFSNENPKIALEKMNIRLKNASNSICKTHFLMLTLGTAWFFLHKEKQAIVSNCHKLPAETFIRKRLKVEDIVILLKKPLDDLTSINPDLQIILSISPIRHLKDGLHENQISKATLLLAAEKLCSEFKNIHYFPAYELMLDDLRDYRFYASDMTHPSNQAIDYIWEKFEESCLKSNDNQLRKEISQLAQAVNHRLFNPTSEKSRKFAAAQLKLIGAIKKQAPYLNFDSETAYFNAIIHNSI